MLKTRRLTLDVSINRISSDRSRVVLDNLFYMNDMNTFVTNKILPLFCVTIKKQFDRNQSSEFVLDYLFHMNDMNTFVTKKINLPPPISV